MVFEHGVGAFVVCFCSLLCSSPSKVLCSWQVLLCALGQAVMSFGQVDGNGCLDCGA